MIWPFFYTLGGLVASALSEETTAAGQAHGIPSDTFIPQNDSRTLVQSTLQNFTLRAGVIDAPPFAMLTGDDEWTGFEGDLLVRLKSFALDGGYNVTFDLELGPQHYKDALNLISNDCNTTSNPNALADCQKYDFILGDYYVNSDRSDRIEFSPPYLRTTMSAIKTVKDDSAVDYKTLTQLSAAEGAAACCVPAGTYLSTVVMAKFPKIKYNDCPSPDECVQLVKNGTCALYVDDELALRYRALSDVSLEMTGEQFNQQFIVWPISYRLNPKHSQLLKRWMYESVENATLDELSYKYFTIKLCPLGSAGPNCDLNCDSKHGRSDRVGRCVCHSMKWSGDECSIEVKEDLKLFPKWEVALCYVFFGINTFAIFLCGTWIIVHRNTKQVQVWQPFFLSLILLGCLISSSSIIPTAQQNDSYGQVKACMAFPWLFSLGFSITFGSLLAKIRRVYLLFRAAASMSRVTVTVKETFALVCGITAVDFLICLVWTIVDPLQWKREITRTDQFNEPLESVGYCTSDNWKAFISIIAAWHLVLLGIASVLCYKTRNISTKFSESKYVAVAMISNLQIFLISVPVLILLGGDPSTSLFIRAAVIWLNDAFILFVIFGSLMYSVHFPSVGQDSINIGSAVNEYKSKERH